MEDYLPTQKLQRAVEFMWHRHLLEDQMAKETQKGSNACVSSKLAHFANQVQFREVMENKGLLV